MICTLCNSPLTIKINDYFYDCNTCKALVKDNKYYLSGVEEKAIYNNHNNDVNNSCSKTNEIILIKSEKYYAQELNDEKLPKGNYIYKMKDGIAQLSFDFQL